MLYYRNHKVDKNGNFIKVNDNIIVDSEDNKVNDT